MLEFDLRREFVDAVRPFRELPRVAIAKYSLKFLLAAVSAISLIGENL